MTTKVRFIMLVVAVLFCFGVSNPAGAQRRHGLKVKLATVAPKNSVWHDALMRMAQDWRDISNGTIDLVIYPGGVAGDEETMLRKMRAGQLQAALMSGAGMAYVDTGVSALQSTHDF